MIEIPAVEGIISAAQVAQTTVDAIAAIQLPDGNIPWTPGRAHRPVEPRRSGDGPRSRRTPRRARAAYDWLARMQRPDGAWHAYYLGNEIEDPTLDTNVTCYIATGAWHHYLTTGDTAVPAALWPTVEAAIDFALDFQRETGEIAWRGDDPADGALLTGSSSIHLSLRCAIAIAERLGHERPDWELSLGVARDRRRPPARRVPRQGPLGDGLVLPDPRRRPARLPAHARLASRWPQFVVDGPRRSLRLRPTVDHRRRDVRAGDGARRSGSRRPGAAALRVGAVPAVGDGAATGPAPTSRTRPSCSTASSSPTSSPPGTRPRSCSPPMRLAGTGPTAGLFRGERLPEVSAAELLAAGVEIERERAAHRGTPTPAHFCVAHSAASTRRSAQAAGGRGRHESLDATALPHFVGALGRRRPGPRTRRGTRAGRRARRDVTSPRSRRARRRTRDRRR